jgi:DNA (cytosine-5)-methyltransferase 1
MIENVPAVERDKSRVVKRARNLLERLGYATDTMIVSAVDIGVAQRRQRHVLLAMRDGNPDIEAAVRAARTPRPRDLSWAINDLLGKNDSRMDAPGILSPANRKRAEYLLKRDEYDLPNRHRPMCQRGPHKYKSMYGRLRWDEPAQTITSGFGSPGQGRYLHPELARTLTPHEAARLQFFPDWFNFDRLKTRRELARAIGNAVPPKLAFVVAHHVFYRPERASRVQGRGAAVHSRYEGDSIPVVPGLSRPSEVGLASGAAR